MTDQQKRPIAVDDLYKIVKVSDSQISPDGKWVAYVRTTVDKVGNGYHSSIWISSLSDSTAKPRQLTRGKSDSQPRWSPDGQTLAFVSVRGDKPQIYLLPLTEIAGEARQLTSVANGATSPAWSKDGQSIAFLSALTADERANEGEEQEPPADALAGKHQAERKAEDDKKRYDPFHMWRIPYREGTQFVSGHYAQVYVMSTIEGDDVKPVRLTDIDAHHTPPEWSADGKFLYTSRQIDVTRDEPFTYMGVYRLSANELTEPELLLSREGFTYIAPLVSPDGKYLAFASVPVYQEGGMAANSRLNVVALDDVSDVKELARDLDRSIDSYVWSADSQSVYFNFGDWGTTPVFKVDVTSNTFEPVVQGNYQVSSFDVADDGQIVGTVNTAVNPYELYLFPSGDGDKVALTAFNEKWLSEVIVQETHEIRYTSPSGTELQGWFIYPVGYEEGVKYPLALNIHGGPRAMWASSEPSMFHEWQFHAARGYAVFYCNPRGAEGYGEQFKLDLYSAWGDVAMDDIMTGVDLMIEKGFVDPERLAITGGSYGGYMTSWIVGHTDRFKSAVTQRGVYNLVSFYGTSDIPILISNDFSVEPWEDHELLWKHSPLAYAKNITTPLLILHAENDFRVPIEQAEQLFAWVRRATDTPVEMWRYPREGHELSRSGEPEHRVSRLTKMVEWFDKYCV
jgi:dipeptidyl aminopeptidase/acylaminoacyl peptidase